jgi:hypothetical protein
MRRLRGACLPPADVQNARDVSGRARRPVGAPVRSGGALFALGARRAAVAPPNDGQRWLAVGTVDRWANGGGRLEIEPHARGGPGGGGGRSCMLASPPPRALTPTPAVAATRRSHPAAAPQTQPPASLPACRPPRTTGRCHRRREWRQWAPALAPVPVPAMAREVQRRVMEQVLGQVPVLVPVPGRASSPQTVPWQPLLEPRRRHWCAVRAPG